jgi:hypothetical protein
MLLGMPALPWLDVITRVQQDQHVLSYHSSFHGNLQVLFEISEG